MPTLSQEAVFICSFLTHCKSPSYIRNDDLNLYWMQIGKCYSWWWNKIAPLKWLNAFPKGVSWWNHWKPHILHMMKCHKFEKGRGERWTIKIYETVVVGWLRTKVTITFNKGGEDNKFRGSKNWEFSHHLRPSHQFPISDRTMQFRAGSSLS